MQKPTERRNAGCAGLLQMQRNNEPQAHREPSLSELEIRENLMGYPDSPMAADALPFPVSGSTPHFRKVRCSISVGMTDLQRII